MSMRPSCPTTGREVDVALTVGGRSPAADVDVVDEERAPRPRGRAGSAVLERRVDRHAVEDGRADERLAPRGSGTPRRPGWPRGCGRPAPSEKRGHRQRGPEALVARVMPPGASRASRASAEERQRRRRGSGSRQDRGPQAGAASRPRPCTSPGACARPWRRGRCRRSRASPRSALRPCRRAQVRQARRRLARRSRPARDLRRQPRPPLRAAADHHAVGARHSASASRARREVDDVAVGDDRDRHRLLDRARSRAQSALPL